MMNPRRRISSDPQGGYGISSRRTITEEPQTDEDFSFRTVTDEPVRTTDEYGYENRTYDRVAYAPETERETAQSPDMLQGFEYSRPYFAAGYTKTLPSPAKTKKARKREREDVMPTIRTRAYGKPEEEPEETVAPKAKSRLSGKTKAALFAYVAAVVILAIIVIATGLAVSNIGAQASELESEIAAKNNTLSSLNAQIEASTDLDRVTGAAYNNGMSKIETSETVDLLPTVDSIEYEGRTNWFDKFCDFIGKIIGG